MDRKRITAGLTRFSQQTGIRPTPSDGGGIRVDGKYHRNQPCPCGSERKYKHCHGSTAPVPHKPPRRKESNNEPEPRERAADAAAIDHPAELGASAPVVHADAPPGPA